MAKTTIHSDYIPDNAITGVKIAENSITAREIATNAITSLYVADDSVTADKLANSINTDIATGVAALPKAGGTMTGNLVIQSDGGNEQFVIKRNSAQNEQLIFGFHSSDYATIQSIEQGVAYRNLSLNSAGGNVGIGTTSPAFENGNGLEIRNSSGNGAHLKLTDNASGTGATQGFDLYMFNSQGYIENYENAPIIFRQNGGETARFDASRRLGIGTNNPAYDLDIVDSTTASNTNAALNLSHASKPQLRFVQTSNNTRMYIGIDTNDLVIRNDDGVEKVRFEQNGNVGIGGSANKPLTVTADGGANGIGLRARSADDYSFMQFFNNAGTALRGQIYSHSNSIGFTTGTDSSAGNDLYIKDGVGVGIGNIPSAKLDVEGGSGGVSVRVKGDVGGGAYYYGYMFDGTNLRGTTQTNIFYSGSAIAANTTVAEYAGIRIDQPSTAASGAAITHNYGIYQSGTAQKNYFAGKMGIGTTSPDEKLDVENGNIRIKSNSDGSTGLFRLWDAAGTESGQIYPAAGDLKIYSANDILLTQAGKVGIGTTAPAASLDIKFADNANPLRLHYGSSPANFYLDLDTTIPTGGVVAYNWNIKNNGSNYANVMVLDRDMFILGNANGYGSRLTVQGAITTIAGSNDLASISTETGSVLSSGTIKHEIGYAGTYPAGKTFTWTYAATNWKAFHVTLHVAGTAGFTTYQGGGYNNNGGPMDTIEQGNNIGSFEITRSGQTLIFTYTVGSQNIHPFFEFTYRQSGGDGAPRMDRLSLVQT